MTAGFIKILKCRDSHRISNPSIHNHHQHHTRRSYQTVLFILVASTFVLIVCYTTIIIRNTGRRPPHGENRYHDDGDGEKIGHGIHKKGGMCHLPKLNPFDASILEYVREKIPSIDCTKGNGTNGVLETIWPLLFTSHVEDQTGRSILVSVTSPRRFGFKNCCYKTFWHRNGTQYENVFSKTCIRIRSRQRRIVVSDSAQFVAIQCQNRTGDEVLVDFFEFFPRKSTTRFHTQEHKISTPNPNVVILGLDAMSHMNFIRTMPFSLKFLTETLGAFKMSGYNKVGDNTFPNMVPVLSGLSTDELQESCWKDVNTTFDNCWFIWKKFSDAGYLTAYSEDASWMGTFDYSKEGFYFPPTHYHSKPYLDLLDVHLGHQETVNARLCYGPRLGIQVLFDSVKKLAKSVSLKYPPSSQKYFQLVWQNSLTHDELNFGKLGDAVLLDTLQSLYTSGYLNKDTILIVTSDHGIRWGDITDTVQGKIEASMPLLYFVLPHWFKKRFSRAVRNLRKNENRLTTPFDLHATLLDLVDLTQIENKRLRERQQNLAVIVAAAAISAASTKADNATSIFATKNNSKNVQQHSDDESSDDMDYDEILKIPRGISLFLPIPLGRSCEDAGIVKNWCLCGNRVPLTMDDLENSPVLKEGADWIVEAINKKFQKFPQCSKLTLDKIVSGQIIQQVDSKESDESFRLRKKQPITFYMTIAVKPSEAHFETSITRTWDGEWSLGGDIGRTNLYGNQSRCVREVHLKKFCFCSSD